MIKIINLIGATGAAVYLVFIFISRDLNPLQWPFLLQMMALATFFPLLIIGIIVQNGIEKDTKEADKYFEDRTHE